MVHISLYTSSFLFGVVGAWAAFRFAAKVGLLDCPTERSSHCSPTPRCGGVGILAAFLLSSLVSGISFSFWLPVIAVSVLAFFGDRTDLSPKWRFSGQMIMIAFLVFCHLPQHSNTYLLWVLFWTIFIVGTANFYNFMDGVNGIAGITGVLAFGMMSIFIFMNDRQSSLSTISICISLACLGFLPLNFPNAKVFMGDIGSILLGLVFGTLVFFASKTLLDFICLASFLFPFYVDELTTMYIRLRDGECLMQPHRRHIYQLLANEYATPHWKVAVGFGSVQVLVGSSIMIVKPFGIPAALALLCLFFIAFVFFSFHLRSTLQSQLRDGAS